MANLNLYYSREILSDADKKKKYFALPIKEILIDVYVDRKKLNLYQEIILDLYKCGCGNIEDIEEVLKLNSFHSEKSNTEDRESLIKYIIKELTKLGYIKDDNITQSGNDILEENLDDEKLLGSLFYNPFTKKYINFLLINDLYKLEVNERNLDKIELIEEKGKIEKVEEINLGTPGKPKKIKVKFLDMRDLQKKALDIEQFIKIITKELRTLNNKVENLNEDTYSESQKKEFLKEKIENLKKIRKFTEKMEKDAYVLISLDSEENKIRTSFEPELSDYKLKEKLKSEPLIANLINQNIDIENGTSENENIEIRIKYDIKEQEIIKDSNNQLSKLPNLVRNLSNLSGLKEDRENYKENIKLIYESFGEILLYLLGDINLIKIKNKGMELERILKNNNYSDELINTYIRFDEGLNHIKDNKKLIDLICHLIIAEERKEDKKFQNYLKKNKKFLNFLKKLINKRNEFSHSEKDYDMIDSEENIEIEYYFELEARKKLYEFIEEIFNFKFKDSINFTTIDEDTENKIRKKSNKKINNEFSNVIISEVRNELLETRIFFEYYKNFKNQIYKALFMNRVAILLEKNMKMIKKNLNRILEIEDIKKYCKKDDKLEKIYLEEVEANFLKVSTENEWINNEFNKIKGIYILLIKVEGASKNFSKGTLNNNAVTLLALKNKNSILEELINNCLDFFKLIFIVSSFRGHNGDFHFKNENNDTEEIEEVEAFLKTVYEIEKKVLKIIGEKIE